MFPHLQTPLTFTHAPVHTLPSNVRTSPSWASPNFTTFQQQRRRLLVRPPLPFSVPRLHPIDSAPEGVPSSLFKFPPKKYPVQKDSSGVNISGVGDAGGDSVRESRSGGGAIISAPTPVGALEAGLVEDSDLGSVSSFLVEVRVTSWRSYTSKYCV